MHGILKSYRPSACTISVGNITVGGTGKTPMVIHLCKLFKGKRVAVVSRGYASRGKGVRIVSDGDKILCTPEVCGDEPYLIANSVPDAVVAVGKNRMQVMQFVESQYKPDIIILDDGFSHLKVKRDIDILLIDGENGVGNGHLLPAGPLREPINSIKYADIIGIKGRHFDATDILSRYTLKENIFYFSYKFNGLKRVENDATIDMNVLKNKKIVAIAGIAFPESFFNLIYSIGIQPLKAISKPDHVRYASYTLKKLVEKYKPDAIIVTGKDAMKIKHIDRDPQVMWVYVDIVVEEHDSQLITLLAKKGCLQ